MSQCEYLVEYPRPGSTSPFATSETAVSQPANWAELVHWVPLEELIASVTAAGLTA